MKSLGAMLTNRIEGKKTENSSFYSSQSHIAELLPRTWFCPTMAKRGHLMPGCQIEGQNSLSLPECNGY